MSIESNLSIIYGVGEVGKLLGRILREKGDVIECYVVSRGFKQKDFLDGIKIEEFNLQSGEISAKYIKSRKVYLTTQQNAKGIEAALRKYGFYPIDIWEDRKFVSVYEKYYQDVLKRNSKNGMENGTIKFKKFLVLNPKYQAVDYQLSFYLEMADLLCPLLEDSDGDYVEGPYELGEVFLEEGDFVLDCGSNIGFFALYAATKKCRVCAFEPSKKNQEYLKFIQRQFPKNISIVGKAVGSYNGLVDFDVNVRGTGCRIIGEGEWGDGGEVVKVPIITIDKYVEENEIEKIDFIKADIEGAEREMLRGAFRTLREMAPRLSICTYHLPDDKEVLEQLILEANPNYRIEHRYKKLYAYVP